MARQSQNGPSSRTSADGSRRGAGVLARAVAAALPLTRRGIILACLSILLLGLGSARADMAGLFWGASFLLAALSAVIGGHVTCLLIRRTTRAPGSVEVLLPQAALSPGDEAEARISVRMPRAFPPGFTVRFTVVLDWHERSMSGVGGMLHPGANRASVSFRAGPRGSYHAERALFEARDILGLARCPFALSVDESVRILPRVLPLDRSIRIREEGGDSVRYASRRRRSEEMLEVRKYFPGDDIRRLNWKVFAHAGEMFLRIGEETPPPESLMLFILDSTANPLVPPGAAADYLDRLVESSATAMATLLGRGMEILFWSPGSPASRAFTSESRPELLALLSEVWWTKPGWRLELPGRPGMHAVVFSTPGSPSLARLMGEIGRRGWRASLVLPDLDVPARGLARVRVKDLLFVLPAGRTRPEAPPANALAAFRAALAEERARYGGSRLGDIDAAQA